MNFVSTAHHFFVPRHSNNYKAKVLHAEFLVVTSFILLLLQGLISVGTYSSIAILGYASNISINDVVALSNQKRAENGKNTLTFNSQLSEAARLKGLDMLEKDYWAHISPDGVEPWDFFNRVGYVYRYAGENLARDFSTPQSAVDAWMASPSHRDNLLSEKYTEIGIAVVEGDMNGIDTTIIVQLFGTRAAPQVASISEVNEEENKVTAPVEERIALSVPEAQAQQPDIELEPISLESSTGFRQDTPLLHTSIITPFITTRVLSVFIIGVLSLVLVIDIVEIERKSISKVRGRRSAHLAYLFTIIVIALVAKAGEIL